MKYCSECGGQIHPKQGDSDSHPHLVCARCGLVFRVSPKIIVACLVHRKGKLLVCRRAHEPGRGKWTVPCGFLEIGETLQQAAARETLEEAGVIVSPRELALYSVISLPDIGQVVISFRTCLRREQHPRPGPECTEAAFMSEQDIPPVEIAWREALQEQPQRFFRELRARRFTVQIMSTRARAAEPQLTEPFAEVRP